MNSPEVYVRLQDEACNGEGPYNFSLIFSLKEQKGELIRSLQPFQDLGINMTHIESRPSQTKPGLEYDFYVDCVGTEQKKVTLVEQLKANTLNVSVLTREPSKDEVPWFPRRIQDLDRFANQVLSYGAELESDHPVSCLQEDRRSEKGREGRLEHAQFIFDSRQKEFADIAFFYKHGKPIPKVKYTEDETKTWGTIFSELMKLYPSHACKEHNFVFPLMEKNCGYRVDNIPQLEDVSNFLKECSGFRLRPVAGLLSSRDFLAGLAFRVFHSTQYIRHSSRPMHTPEPDVCHELLGHAPLLCNETFAQFSQEIGLASLGASEDYIKKLATLYWLTIECGLCQEDGKTKAYGAAILSSFGELQYALSDKPEVRPLDPATTSLQSYPITEMQPVYFKANSFQEAKEKVMEFAKTIPRPFAMRYNPYTESIEVINDKPSVQKLVSDIKHSVDVLDDVLQKLP